MSPAARLLTGDVRLLFVTRFVRLFAYGALSVVLVLHLVAIGIDEAAVGVLLTATLMGDTIVSLLLSTQADRVGRRRVLIAGAVLMAMAGVVFASTHRWWLLLLAGIVGIVSPSGHEVGPFLAIEQAALAQLVAADRRTAVFAWYALTGSLATALGSLAGGLMAQMRLGSLLVPADAYRSVIVLYAAVGGVLALAFFRLSRGLEPAPADRAGAPGLRWMSGIHRSRATVWRLSALFGLDSFGGGFVVQGFTAYWFHLRFGLDPGSLGLLFLAANLLAGCSALLAASLAARIGLINTMVATHLPSNVLLILVPLMPTLPLAIAVLLLRFSISQMDVPARQSYTMAVVSPDERSAAAGITGVARTLGAAISPMFAGALLARAEWMDVPFFLAGGLKIAYDLLLYRSFVALRPPEEKASSSPRSPW